MVLHQLEELGRENRNVLSSRAFLWSVSRRVGPILLPFQTDVFGASDLPKARNWSVFVLSDDFCQWPRFQGVESALMGWVCCGRSMLCLFEASFRALARGARSQVPNRLFKGVLRFVRPIVKLNYGVVSSEDNTI